MGDPGGRSSGPGLKPGATTGIRRKLRKSYGIPIPQRQSFLLSSSRAPKFRDAAASRRQSFLRCRAGSSKSFGARISHVSKFPDIAWPRRPRLRRADPRAPSDSDPLATFPTRRGPWEGPAKSRFAPGVSRGGPGAASRDPEAPGPCPGTPPAFRGQNPVSAGSSCPLKPGWIREAPGFGRAAVRRGEAPATDSDADPPAPRAERPSILQFSKRRTFSVRRMDTRARRPPGLGRFPPLRPGLSPGKARPWTRRPQAKPGPCSDPASSPADPGF